MTEPAAHGVRMFRPLFYVAATLRSGRFDLTTEAAMQRDIAALLTDEWGEADLEGRAGWCREYRLSAEDRPDFVLQRGGADGGLIAIEAKHRRARPTQVLRQLARYAAHPEVVALVLASGVPMTTPAELGGKPLAYVGLGGAWL